MLVLTRNPESGVHIGPDITVKVLSIKRHAVKLGIEAPDSVRVWRDELAPLTEEPPPRLTTQSKNTVGMKIVLVVEDDKGHAHLIRKALCQQQGTMVTVTGTAGGAIDALGAHPKSVEDIVHPDLILLDLGLPDGSGLDVLRTIQSTPELRTTPVVVLSCRCDETIMQQCMEAGANAFVEKSVNYDDFFSLVGRIGQFWAGDCFARRSLSHPTDVTPTLTVDATATKSSNLDEFEEKLGGSNRCKRILLADDEAGHVTLIMRALRRANINCAVDVVSNGVEAIEYLFGVGEHGALNATELPDLILLDLNMPSMTGRQVLQVLRNVRREERVSLPPVVVLTSSDEETDINDSYNLGAQSFIRKPVHHGRFAEAVQQTTQYWLGLNEAGSRGQAVTQRANCPR